MSISGNNILYNYFYCVISSNPAKESKCITIFKIPLDDYGRNSIESLLSEYPAIVSASSLLDTKGDIHTKPRMIIYLGTMTDNDYERSNIYTEIDNVVISRLYTDVVSNG